MADRSFIQKIRAQKRRFSKCKSYFRFLKALRGPFLVFTICYAIHIVALTARCMYLFLDTIEYQKENPDIKKGVHTYHWIGAVLTLFVTEVAVMVMTARDVHVLKNRVKTKLEVQILRSFILVFLKCQFLFASFLPRPEKNPDKGPEQCNEFCNTNANLYQFEICSAMCVFAITIQYYIKWCHPQEKSELVLYYFERPSPHFGDGDEELGEEGEEENENVARGV